MSCMYLNKSHYQFVADALYSCCVVTQQQGSFCDARKQLEQFQGGAMGQTALEREIVSFVRALQDCNARAYADRYNEPVDVPEYIKTAGDRAMHEPVDVITARLLKALECVKYQCSDVKDWQCHDLNRVLGRIIDDCRRHLINKLQAYKEAPWAIDY